MSPLTSIISILLTIIGFCIIQSQASPTRPSSLPRFATQSAGDIGTDICATNTSFPLINLWSVYGLNVTYTADETIKHGSAMFTLMNTYTNYTECLNCSLRFNSICEFHGTPGDKGLQIWLQLNLELAYVTINQSMPCPSTNSSAFAVGMAELALVCPEDYSDDMTCVSGDGLGYANGSINLDAWVRPPRPRLPRFFYYGG